MEKSNLVTYAEKELKLAGFYDEDSDYGGVLPESILKVVEAFSDEGHSGGSAAVSIALLQKLLRFEPLTPLTGNDDEWSVVNIGSTTDSPVYQNMRCSHVFKDETGAYDSEGKIFREKDGATYQSRDSRVYITFPYVPKREYVDVVNH